MWVDSRRARVRGRSGRGNDRRGRDGGEMTRSNALRTTTFVTRAHTAGPIYRGLLYGTRIASPVWNPIAVRHAVPTTTVRTRNTYSSALHTWFPSVSPRLPSAYRSRFYQLTRRRSSRFPRGPCTPHKRVTRPCVVRETREPSSWPWTGLLSPSVDVDETNGRPHRKTVRNKIAKPMQLFKG